MKPEIVLTFRNTRDALGAEEALLAGGLAVRVMSRPSALGEGCGICLRLDEGLRERAEPLLAAAGIEAEAAYRKIRDADATHYEKAPLG